MSTAPTLIFAIGNESRGDDALGPVLLREINLMLNDNNLSDLFDLIEDYQLQIEHAMDMKDRKRVLFVDAGMDTKAPFSFHRASNRNEPVLYSHALAPEALLSVYQQFYGEMPPDAYILCIRGYGFELGAPPSSEARENLSQSLQFFQKLMLPTCNWEALTDGFDSYPDVVPVAAL